MDERTCLVDGCQRVAWAKDGLCRLHWMRRYRTGDINRGPKRQAAQCQAIGCAGDTHARSFCRRHHDQAVRIGLVLPPKKAARPAKSLPCRGDGCDRMARSSDGYCSMHYERNKRNGTPDRKTPAHRIVTRGYVYVIRAGHPLSAGVVNKYVAEHRIVLFDAIGPGTHPCHWCSKPVRWDGRWPKDLDALVVDHLDDVKGNNDRDNLVASCNPCNVARAQIMLGQGRASQPA